VSAYELRILDAMSDMGGHFVRGLASLYCVADPENRRRIRETWPDEWAKYEAFANPVVHAQEEELV
jgi:hypothetical protein